MNLSTEVKSRRYGLGWTQEELANNAGISKRYISHIEIGDRNPSLEVKKKIAMVLGEDLCEELSNESTKNNLADKVFNFLKMSKPYIKIKKKKFTNYDEADIETRCGNDVEIIQVSNYKNRKAALGQLCDYLRIKKLSNKKTKASLYIVGIFDPYDFCKTCKNAGINFKLLDI